MTAESTPKKFSLSKSATPCPTCGNDDLTWTGTESACLYCHWVHERLHHAFGVIPHIFYVWLDSVIEKRVGKVLAERRLP